MYKSYYFLLHAHLGIQVPKGHSPRGTQAGPLVAVGGSGGSCCNLVNLHTYIRKLNITLPLWST